MLVCLGFSGSMFGFFWLQKIVEMRIEFKKETQRRGCTRSKPNPYTSGLVLTDSKSGDKEDGEDG